VLTRSTLGRWWEQQEQARFTLSPPYHDFIATPRTEQWKSRPRDAVIAISSPSRRRCRDAVRRSPVQRGVRGKRC